MAASISVPGSPDGNPIASGRPSLPILLALVGGGVGLVVFLMRKGSNQPQSSAAPNEAIMLGSLQEHLLNLEGSVGKSESDLQQSIGNAQLSTNQQLGDLGSSITGKFAGLQDYLSGQFGGLDTNTKGLGLQIADVGSHVGAVQNQLGSIIAGQNGQLQTAQSLNWFTVTNTQTGQSVHIQAPSMDVARVIALPRFGLVPDYVWGAPG